MAQPKRFFYGWVIVASTTFMMFFVIANPFSVVLKQLMAEFHTGRGLISWAPSLLTISAGLTGLFIGRLLINRSPRKFMIWGSALSGISLILIGFTYELWQVFLLYFITGLFTAICGSIPLFTLLSKWFVKKFGTATGFIMAGGGIGMMIIMPILGIIAENFGWRATYFFIGSAVLVFNLPILIFLIKDSPDKLGLLPDGDVKSAFNSDSGKQEGLGKKDKPNLVSFIKNPALWAIAFGFAFIQMGDSAVTYHQIAFITDMHIREAVAASALGFTLGISTVARIGSGWLADRISVRYVAIFFLAVEIMGMWLLLRVNNMTDVWLFVVVYGLGVGASSTLFPIILRDRFGSTAFSMLFSITDVCFKIGSSAGAVFAGYLYDSSGSYHLVFLIVILLYILGAVLLYLSCGVSPVPFLKKRSTALADPARDSAAHNSPVI